jgi:SAM-dependent methyltransferase
VLRSTPAEPDLVWSTYAAWKLRDHQRFGRFLAGNDAYYDAEIGSVLRGRSRPRVLEIGAGNAPFLGWGLSRGFDYRGVELIPEQLARARRLGVASYPSLGEPSLQAQRGELDCVVALDVLEHVPQADLPASFQAIAALLKPGGYFVARFPNGDSPFGRAIQHGDLTHATTLGRGKIHQLSSLAGLTLISLGEPASVAAQGIGARLSRLLEAAARRVVERVSAELYFDGESVSFSPELVAVLQKP